MAEFTWQIKGWPKFKFDHEALKGDLDDFTEAFGEVKDSLRLPEDLQDVARMLTVEAVRTSAIEGVNVDESVVMSSICRVLGVPFTPPGFSRDIRAEGVAQMVLAIRQQWNAPLTEKLILKWHGALLDGDLRGIAAGEYRKHPVNVVRNTPWGEMEIRYKAPPSESVPNEMRRFIRKWKSPVETPADIALKATFMHPHFESIHPFEDGNGRVGRALTAKTIAEGLGAPAILPISTTIARHRRDYYEAIHSASTSLEWTEWAKFFIPVLTESLKDFLVAARFVIGKKKFLEKYEPLVSERALKVLLRMFKDGPSGVAAGLSASKWTRMTKVSKPTATRDLEELAKTGAIIMQGAGPATHYELNFDYLKPVATINEPINDGINDGIKNKLESLIKEFPGRRVPFFIEKLAKSSPTIQRAIASLISEDKIEHRGSKKTGGYFIKDFSNPQ